MFRLSISTILRELRVFSRPKHVAAYTTNTNVYVRNTIAPEGEVY
jgi:hypothetical protein